MAIGLAAKQECGDSLEEMIRVLNAEGIETELLEIGRDNIRGCIACGYCAKAGRCAFTDAVNDAAQKIHKVQDILIQVNLAQEDSKFGIYKEDLPILVQKADMMKNVHLTGLMCIAPNYEDVEECRPLFREMREIFDRLKDFPLFSSEMKYLSMGMTHDYKIAVEEGANLVRVGTAIFGARHY